MAGDQGESGLMKKLMELGPVAGDEKILKDMVPAFLLM